MNLFLSMFIATDFALATPDDVEPSDVVPVNMADGPKGIGVGFAAGEPTGISLAWRAEGPSTFAGVAGWSLTRNHLHLHIDYLLTLARLQPDPALPFTLNLFVGIGPSIDLGASTGSTPILGIRTPLGVDFIFGNTPLDLYLDLVPVIGLFPDTRPNVQGAFGLRLWFEPN